jgi:hypothetical protein
MTIIAGAICGLIDLDSYVEQTYHGDTKCIQLFHELATNADDHTKFRYKTRIVEQLLN